MNNIKKAAPYFGFVAAVGVITVLFHPWGGSSPTPAEVQQSTYSAPASCTSLQHQIYEAVQPLGQSGPYDTNEAETVASQLAPLAIEDNDRSLADATIQVMDDIGNTGTVAAVYEMDVTHMIGAAENASGSCGSV